MKKSNTFTLKKLVLALALAGYTMSSAYAVLTPATGTIQGVAPVLIAPSNPTADHTIDLRSNAAGATLASGDTITLTYTYNDTDGDLDDSSTTHTQWFYVRGGVDTLIASGNVANTAATASGGDGTSVLTIPAAAIGADAIKVVIQEYSQSGDPINGQTITVADTHIGGGGTTTPPGPIVVGSNVTPGIYLSTDTGYTNNLIGKATKLNVGDTYVFKLWDSAGVGTIDLTSTVPGYNWRLVGTSATDNITAPGTGFVTSVTGGNFTIPVNTAADGTVLTKSADGAQGFKLAVDY